MNNGTDHSGVSADSDDASMNLIEVFDNSEPTITHDESKENHKPIKQQPAPPQDSSKQKEGVMLYGDSTDAR